MLRARSALEAHLYMDLHPCECGSSDFGRLHRLVQGGDGMVAVYEGPCRACGRDRSLAFLMADDIPPPHAFGGAEPSQIIDPGEFAEVGHSVCRRAGFSLLDSPESEHHRYRAAVAYGLAAFEEVPKFIPPGADAVPASAFTTEVGRARYEREPAKFDRDILEMDIDLSRKILADIDNVSRPRGRSGSQA